MKAAFIIALRTTVVTLILTGIAYPLVVTSLAQVFFSGRANGSLVTDERGRIVGSALIGQPFTHPAYFQPRPSTAGTLGYDASASGGSNLGPTSQKLYERVVRDVERLKEENPEDQEPIPLELVTTSASGLDPHVSPAAALWQVPRVAYARGIAAERVKAVVEQLVEERTLGLFGEPRVNVLLLNLALDRQFGRPNVRK
jgi:potassium-transporting ATPase KdpC subunit